MAQSETGHSQSTVFRALDQPYVDLAERHDLSFALLSDNSWRERAIHEIVLRDSDHVNVTSAYQIRLSVDFVSQYAPNVRSGDWVRLLLPFTVRPNGLMLNVDFRGVLDQPTSLLLRERASQLQAEHLALANDRLFTDEPMEGELWVGVSAYTTVTWREHQARVKPKFWRALSEPWTTRLFRVWKGAAPEHFCTVQDTWRQRALVSYLNKEFEPEVSSLTNEGLVVDVDDVKRWLDETKTTRDRLVEALGEGADDESSSECILLAIPFIPVRINDIDEIDRLVHEYCSAAENMDDLALKLLAEYGRRWQAILDTVVPVGRPCSIKLSEQRPWVATPSPIMEQEFVLGEAATTHIEIRAADPGVVIKKPSVSNVLGTKKDLDLVHERRETADAIAFYAATTAPRHSSISETVRIERERETVRVSVRASVRLSQQLLFIWLYLLIGVAALAVVSLPENDNLIGSFALLIFPLTLAGVLVLSRESTSLAERLLRRWRSGLGLAIAGIWIMALCRLLLFADVRWAEAVWTRIAELIR